MFTTTVDFHKAWHKAIKNAYLRMMKGDENAFHLYYLPQGGEIEAFSEMDVVPPGYELASPEKISGFKTLDQLYAWAERFIGDIPVFPPLRSNTDASYFCGELQAALSTHVQTNRTVRAEFRAGLAPGPGRGYVIVDFINLPIERFRERRGGGAESENNRMTFFAEGFGRTESDPATKVSIRQLKNGIYRHGFPSRENRAPDLRKKTATPDKAATYLANYINNIAAEFEPNFTHG